MSNDYVNVGHKRMHVVVAEAAMGRALPAGSVVHHVDAIRNNNTPTNLVVCPDRAYHAELHRKMVLVERSANPFTTKLCRACNSVKHLSAFGAGRTRTSRRNCWSTLHYECKPCASRRTQETKARAKAK